MAAKKTAMKTVKAAVKAKQWKAPELSREQIDEVDLDEYLPLTPGDVVPLVGESPALVAAGPADLSDIYARAQGLPYVELTTDPDNLASQRVIIANGGLLIEAFINPVAFGSTPGLRFRIPL